MERKDSEFAYVPDPENEGQYVMVKLDVSSEDNSNQTRRWNRAAMAQHRIGLNLAAPKRKNGKSKGFIERCRANRNKTSNMKNTMC